MAQYAKLSKKGKTHILQISFLKEALDLWS